MLLRRWGIVGLLLLAGLVLWLMLAGPDTLMGLDMGSGGMTLLVAIGWGLLYLLSQWPRGELDRAMSPSEWRAWLGVGFSAIALMYFFTKLALFQGDVAFTDPHVRAVGRNLVILLIAWAVISQVLRSRSKDEVQKDERDREIAIRAGGWGRGATVVAIIALALLLGFSPAERLVLAGHFMIANLLIFALVWGCLIEYAATAFMFWRDRR